MPVAIAGPAIPFSQPHYLIAKLRSAESSATAGLNCASLRDRIASDAAD
jgi:LysR family glycine cleavage system transcriptional activator